MPSPTTDLPPPRQRRKEARPQELVDAALELFAEKGFAATRSEEVAARAGVAKGTLYLYYPSKEDLLRAVITQGLSDVIKAGASHVDAFAGTTPALMRSVLAPWWIDVYDSPSSAVFKLMIAEMRNFPAIAEFYVREVVEPGKALIGRIVRRGIDRGEFRRVDVPTAVMSVLLPLVMLCLHKHSLAACAPKSGEVDPHRFIAEHVELMIAGLSVPAATKKARKR